MTSGPTGATGATGGADAAHPPVTMTARQATDESLTVSGRRVGDPQGGRFLHVERGYGEFSRAFAFPDRIAVRGIAADFRNGLLTITVPKLPPPAAQRIDVTP